MAEVAARTPNIGPCSVEGCDNPMRKRQWCASHYSQWKRLGRVQPFTYKWAEPGGECVVCGDPVPPKSGRRKHCSNGCQQAASRTGGGRPKELTCDFCGQQFSTGRRDDGRLQRVDTKWCPDCGRTSPDVQRFRRYGITREQYEAAVALGCMICGRTERKLHVDHDHSCCPSIQKSCGKCVRGLICGSCNRALGLLGDDAETLRRAAAYLDDATPRSGEGTVVTRWLK